MAVAPDVTDVLLADPVNRKKRLFKTRQIDEKGCLMASHNTDRSDIYQVKGWGKKQNDNDQRKEKVETGYSKKHKSTIMR